MRLRPRPRASANPIDDQENPSKEGETDEARDVLWEVGSSSEASEDEDEDKKKPGLGVGGIMSHGERGGLLLNPDGADEEDKQTPTQPGFSAGLTPAETNPFADSQSGKGEDEDEFGEYEGVDEDAVELSRRIDLPK